MKNTCTRLLIAASLGAFGCGGSTASTASSQGSGTQASSGGSGGGHHEGGEHHAHGEHHEGGDHAHNFPAGGVTEFHSVLRPVWHSPEGPDRLANACTSAGDLRRHADAIVNGPVPEAARANESAWRAAATSLQTDVGALATECATPQRANVAARFATVHTSFHRLIELLPRPQGESHQH